MRRFGQVIVFLLASFTSATAQEPMIYSSGQASCLTWIHLDREDGPLRYPLYEWVMGYISAFNQNAAVEQRVTAEEPDLYKWLLRFCEGNRDALMSTAAAALVKEFSGKR